MALEPSITPDSSVTPTYWVDMIDVAVELPRGPVGPPGTPGAGWESGNGDPLNPPTASEGGLYVDLTTGAVWVVRDGNWTMSGSSLMGPTGPAAAHGHAEYLPLSGGAAYPMTGKLHGSEGAVFDDPIQVGTAEQDAGPKDAVNIEYLNRYTARIDLARFFGDLNHFREAIDTGHDWNLATEQGIYQQDWGNHAPPGVPASGRTVGLVQKLSETARVQTVCDVERGLMFVRTQKMGNWTDWAPLNPIIETSPPPVSGGQANRTIGQDWGDDWANGTMWIQLEAYGGCGG